LKAAEAGIVRWLVRISCAVALALVGFAHQVPAFANGAFISNELSEYILPDGTAPVICTVDKTHTEHDGGKLHEHGCEACRISASTVLPAPVFVAWPSASIPTYLGPSLSAEATGNRPLFPGGGPRGPPLMAALI
jgi:hypothetical protein